MKHEIEQIVGNRGDRSSGSKNQTPDAPSVKSHESKHEKGVKSHKSKHEKEEELVAQQDAQYEAEEAKKQKEQMEKMKYLPKKFKLKIMKQQMMAHCANKCSSFAPCMFKCFKQYQDSHKMNLMPGAILV